MPRKKPPIITPPAPPLNPDEFFAKPRFDDPRYVAEVMRLVQQLIRQLYAAGLSGRRVESLQEESAAAVRHDTNLVPAGDILFRATAKFPERGTVPRPDDTIEIRRLVHMDDKIRFLAYLLQRYSHHLTQKKQSQTAESVAGIVVALKRILNDIRDARDLERRLQ